MAGKASLASLAGKAYLADWLFCLVSLPLVNSNNLPNLVYLDKSVTLTYLAVKLVF